MTIDFSSEVRNVLLLSCICSIAAEITFSLYISVVGLQNVLGHCFKVMSFYFIYKAIIVSTLSHPYTTLFQHLIRTNQVNVCVCVCVY